MYEPFEKYVYNDRIQILNGAGNKAVGLFNKLIDRLDLDNSKSYVLYKGSCAKTCMKLEKEYS